MYVTTKLLPPSTSVWEGFQGYQFTCSIYLIKKIQIMFHFIYSIIIVLCISVSCVHDSKDQMMNEPSTATASSSALPDATSSENQSFLLCVGCGSNYSPTAADFYRFPANDGGNNSSHGACFRCLQQRY